MARSKHPGRTTGCEERERGGGVKSTARVGGRTGGDGVKKAKEKGIRVGGKIIEENERLERRFLLTKAKSRGGEKGGGKRWPMPTRYRTEN